MNSGVLHLLDASVFVVEYLSCQESRRAIDLEIGEQGVKADGNE